MFGLICWFCLMLGFIIGAVGMKMDWRRANKRLCVNEIPELLDAAKNALNWLEQWEVDSIQYTNNDSGWTLDETPPLRTALTKFDRLE